VCSDFMTVTAGSTADRTCERRMMKKSRRTDRRQPGLGTDSSRGGRSPLCFIFTGSGQDREPLSYTRLGAEPGAGGTPHSKPAMYLFGGGVSFIAVMEFVINKIERVKSVGAVATPPPSDSLLNMTLDCTRDEYTTLTRFMRKQERSSTGRAVSSFHIIGPPTHLFSAGKVFVIDGAILKATQAIDDKGRLTATMTFHVQGIVLVGT